MLAERAKTRLVAHRGDQENAIENTLAAFERAFASGAIYLECDIQVTQDFEPVVIHDNALQRLCGVSQCVSDLGVEKLKVVCRPHFELLTLSALLKWLEDKPLLNIFIEIKPDIRNRISDGQIADLLVKKIPVQLRSQLIWISESAKILQACALVWKHQLGWVAEGTDTPSALLEQRLDYVFMAFEEKNFMYTWKNKGVQVGVYTVNDAMVAAQLLEHGAELVETNFFTQLSTLIQLNHA